MTLKLSWGLQPPVETKVAWGARAIWKNGVIDLVWNRQDSAAPTLAARRAFSDLLNSGPLEDARRVAHELWNEGKLTGDSTEEVTLYTDWRLVIKANPRGSHGYLYLGAFSKEGVK